MQPNVSSEVSTEVGHVAIVPPAAEPAEKDVSVATAVGDNVIIMVRFRPDTTVWEINGLPAHLDKQAWFKLLCERAGSKFETRAGGRGYFRLTRVEYEAIAARNPN
ncbi:MULTISPECIES: hypothetical protein [Methylosinus]|uniref:hypothetical protein n=1 Tax=Methylosinus TaxID=425 RepID=UPI001A9C4C9B|nr:MULTISPECIES: hypothetical protein [Methylosinus]